MAKVYVCSEIVIYIVPLYDFSFFIVVGQRTLHRFCTEDYKWKTDITSMYTAWLSMHAVLAAIHHHHVESD